VIARAERAEDEIKDRAAMMRDVMRERDAAEAELAAERARLDWLQAQEVKRGLEITEGRDDPLPFLVLGEDGTTHWGNTYRAAIDSAMKEGAK
jgi:aminoglycoside phosphotransferase